MWTQESDTFVRTVGEYKLTVYPKRKNYWSFTIRWCSGRGLPVLVCSSKRRIATADHAKIDCMRELRGLGVFVTDTVTTIGGAS